MLSVRCHRCEPGDSPVGLGTAQTGLSTNITARLQTLAWQAYTAYRSAMLARCTNLWCIQFSTSGAGVRPRSTVAFQTTSASPQETSRTPIPIVTTWTQPRTNELCVNQTLVSFPQLLNACRPFFCISQPRTACSVLRCVGLCDGACDGMMAWTCAMAVWAMMVRVWRFLAVAGVCSFDPLSGPKHSLEPPSPGERLFPAVGALLLHHHRPRGRLCLSRAVQPSRPNPDYCPRGLRPPRFPPRWPCLWRVGQRAVAPRHQTSDPDPAFPVLRSGQVYTRVMGVPQLQCSRPWRLALPFSPKHEQHHRRGSIRGVWQPPSPFTHKHTSSASEFFALWSIAVVLCSAPRCPQHVRL